ncbi:PE family protein [Nocardia alni]|uniref:PE family protein n=1 Tax=Nocardia alni TaxID=2815723 RepID=UPI001C219B24|nr:PE family protein [Nocardia alni]
MPLNVDPAELISSAQQLAETARGTAAALPGSWVVPAGADPVSAQAVPALNAQAQALFNQTSAVLRGVHATAGEIGASAAGYSAADAEGGAMVNGAGSDVLTNPIASAENFGPRTAPVYTFPDTGASIDPLTFAEGLHSGPGTGLASGFADDVRQYLGGAHTDATGTVTDTAQTMQNWTPVGTRAATVLTGHASNLDSLGSGMRSLVDGVDTYSGAFQTAKATHPTPQEIIATRQELLGAMRSKNEVAMAAALAKYQEQNARSAATISSYASTVGAKTGTSAATSSAATSAATSNSSTGSGSSDLSSLASMLPLMSMMGAQGLSSQNSKIGDSTDNALSSDGGSGDDSSLPDIGSDIDTALAPMSSSIGDATSAVQNVALGAMPMVAAASSLNAASLPEAAVSDALGPAAAMDAQAAEAGRAGSGMPYMPMMPGGGAGMGAGAGGAERSRVVAWHPDRLMYVDDTPHTEQVIGEKPTIAPTVTPPTPLNQPGGTT